MIHVAIFGCGVIGPVHAAALALDTQTSIRWAVDRDPRRLARIPATFTSYDAAEALADPLVQLACICTPHPEHTHLAVAALAAGKHVLCEKPLASTPADLARLQAAAKARPDLVASGIFQHRFSPLARRLQHLLAAGDFGRVTSLDIQFACTRDQTYYDADDWRGTWTGEGGGVALNQAIHTLDLGLWITGAQPQHVQANASRRLHYLEVEDRLEATLGCAQGLTATFSAINDGVRPWFQRVTATCTRGSFTLGDGHRLAHLDHPNRALMGELTALDEIGLDRRPLLGAKSDYGNYHALQIADVLDAIRSQRPPTVAFADALPANRVVLAAYQSAAIGIPVPLTADPTTYRTPHLPQEIP